MGNKATFIRKLQTGSLPSALAASARPYAVAKDTKGWKASKGCRLCFVGFKLTEKMIARLPDGATIPSSFTVDVPIIDVNIFRSPDTPRGYEFLTTLVEDYQDGIIADSATKKTAIDPLNIDAMIADYFETGRGGTTQKMLREWIENVFDAAFVKRQFQLNETALSESRAVKTAEQIEQLGRGLEAHLLTLTKTKDIFLPHAYLKMVRSHLVRLVEVELLAADDENIDYFVDKIDALLMTDEQLMEDAA